MQSFLSRWISVYRICWWWNHSSKVVLQTKRWEKQRWKQRQGRWWKQECSGEGVICSWYWNIVQRSAEVRNSEGDWSQDSVRRCDSTCSHQHSQGRQDSSETTVKEPHHWEPWTTSWSLLQTFSSCGSGLSSLIQWRRQIRCDFQVWERSYRPRQFERIVYPPGFVNP